MGWRRLPLHVKPGRREILRFAQNDMFCNSHWQNVSIMPAPARPRRGGASVEGIPDLIRHCVFQIACGYVAANDCNALRAYDQDIHPCLPHPR